MKSWGCEVHPRQEISRIYGHHCGVQSQKLPWEHPVPYRGAGPKDCPALGAFPPEGPTLVEILHHGESPACPSHISHCGFIIMFEGPTSCL